MTTHFEFRQFFDRDTWTYSYLLFDPLSKEGILIDPVFEQVQRDLQTLRELKIKLKYTLETHVHADHITGARALREQTGAKIVYGAAAQVACADVLAQDGETLTFGSTNLRALATPGHTNGCTSYLVENLVFTGDALLIRGCGRTDFQQGNPETLYHSIHTQLFSLPESTKLYPGHDYKGVMSSSIGEEKAFNPRLGQNKSLEEFTQIMNQLHLDYPKKLDVALPANLNCGTA